MTAPTQPLPLPTSAARPVFAGTLSVEQDRGRPPTLYLSFRCSACRRRHHHTWNVTTDGTEDWGTYPRQPHCDRVGLHPHGYLITPSPTPANARAFARYTAALAEHHRQAARRAARAGST